MAEETKTNLTFNGNSSSNQTLKYHKEYEFTDLTLEQLFSEPVSLRFVQRKDEVISDDPEDEHEPQEYNFLNLDFEALFNIPVSLNPREREQEEKQTSEQDSRNGFDFLFNRDEIQELLQDSPTTVFVSSKDLKIIITTPPNFEEPSTVELPPPPPVTPTPIAPVSNNDVGTINETQLFISEAVSITGFLLDNDNISPGSGRIISINGIMSGDAGDLDAADPDTIEIATEYGTLEVDLVTGEYLYQLLDASGADDAQGTTFESFTYVFEFSEGGTYSAVLTVTIDLNQAPIGVDDAYDVNQNIDLVIATAATGVLGNDLDPDNSSTITDLKSVIEVNGVGANVGNEIALADGGLLTLNADGTFTFRTNNEFDGLADGETATVTFNYTVGDSENLSDTATVTITVHGVEGVGIMPQTPPINICEVIDPQTESVYWVSCEENYNEREGMPAPLLRSEAMSSGTLGEFDGVPPFRGADVTTFEEFFTDLLHD